MPSSGSADRAKAGPLHSDCQSKGEKEPRPFFSETWTTLATRPSDPDVHVFVVCLADKFYEIVPDDVRKQDPWQGQNRGEMANLATQYLLDLEEQGYALVRCELAVFKPEA